MRLRTGAPPARRARERGATAVVVAILIGVLATFTAIVVNVGHLMAVRGQLQTATDAAALAAAEDLDGTADALPRARATAASYAARHITDRGVDVVISPDADVQFGHWDASLPRDAAFTVITDTSEAALVQLNAVRVTAGREAARSNPVPTFFSGLFSRKETDVHAESIAVRDGPPSDGCPVPIAFADCMVRREDGTLRCDEPLVFNSDGTDNIGFTNLADDPSVSADVVRRILQGECRPVEIGDPVGVNNGAFLGSVLAEFSALEGVRVSAPIVNLGACPVRFNEHPEGAPIVGFASFTIRDVVPPPTKSIVLELDCGEISKQPVGGGGPNFGTLASEPRLVR